MFIDRARIRITGGKGGNGCCSFRREKYVPRGGPDGGDGGHGGDVYFVVDPRLSSLLDFRYHAHWQGQNGVHGKGSDQHGKNGAETLIPVPPGTLVRRYDSAELVADLTAEGDRLLAVHGGRGGKGNARFTTSTNRTPRFAELGEPGEEIEYVLELKLIADVGLVGLPNAGKSTFLGAVTEATPKIADYPFTTLSPNLGVVSLSGYRTLTIADIPGIIEGAADGKGLGHDFLRHIERTRLLLFLIDLGDEDPEATRAVLENELEQHSPAFAKRPKVFALNKADVPENRDRFDEIVPRFGRAFGISALTREGVPELLEHLWEIVDRLRKEEELDADENPVEKEYTFQPKFDIKPTGSGFRVEGKVVLRAVRMTDFENDEAVRHLQMKLDRMGVFKALKRLGAAEGQPIFIGDMELEYRPD